MELYDLSNVINEPTCFKEEQPSLIEVILWKRIGVMVCKKSAYRNCSGALTNYSGRLITVPEDL